MQRLFFALWPDQVVRARIEALAAGLRLSQGRRVPMNNVHITLVFLGAVETAQRVCVESGADKVEADPFDLRLDQLGCWPRSQVLWLGASVLPPELTRLAASLHQGIARCGVKLDPRPFHAHLTLMRRVRRARRGGSVEPVVWPVGDFALVESITRTEGAAYEVLKTWGLGGERAPESLSS